MKLPQTMFGKVSYGMDWLVLIFAALVLGAGLVTMKSFVGPSPFFDKQLVWIFISLAVFFIFSFIDFRFLKRTDILVALFLLSSGLLFFLFLAGSVFKGARSWFDLGGFSFQPSDVVKIFLGLGAVETKEDAELLVPSLFTHKMMYNTTRRLVAHSTIMGDGRKAVEFSIYVAEDMGKHRDFE